MNYNTFELQKIDVRASEVIKNCFYCGKSLSANKTKEHIFNSCWGGLHKTDELICDKCNNDFSSIDGVFVNYINFIMNAWDFKGERQQKVPEIEANENYILEAGAKPKLKNPELEITPKADGSSLIHLRASSKTEARRCLLDGQLESQLGRQLTTDDREIIKQAVSKAQKKPHDVGNLTAKYMLNFQYEYRSIAHTLLKCLALYTPEVVCDSRTQPIRDFVQYNNGDWKDFAVVVDQEASLLVTDIDILEQRYGVHFNAAKIYWCGALQKIIGVVIILGRIQRAVVIAEGYCGPDALLFVIEDTEGGKQLHPYFKQFDDLAPDVSLVQIQYAPPTIDMLVQEFEQIVQSSVSRDAFLHKLKDIAQKTRELSEQALLEYRNCFLDFVLYEAKSIGISVERLEVEAKLEEYGFADLAQHHIGKTYQDITVCSIINTAFTKTLDYLLKLESTGRS